MSTLLFPINHTMTRNDNVKRALFVAHYASLAGIDVKMVEDTDTVFMHRKVYGTGWVPAKGNILSCEYNGRQIIFEYSDFPELGDDWMGQYSHLPIFKFHYNHDLHGGMSNVFPIGPCMILPSDLYGFKKYYELREIFQYTCSNDVISNRQEPRRLAAERRTHVQRTLRTYGNNLDINWKGSQLEFWKSNEHCLASVCVPGACNNMLDRGHYELLGLGVCTISPYIPTTLPQGEHLISGVHYIKCCDDYSDLIEKIEFCRANRDACQVIGHNAKQLFDTISTPTKYWEWIDQCIKVNNND